MRNMSSLQLKTVLWPATPLAAALAVALPAGSSAALDVASFAVTPSTTQAGGHPNLLVAVAFAGPGTGLKGMALHLPRGLSANPRAASFCSSRRLRADLCPARSTIGSVTVAGVAFGFDLAVTRRLYNVRPRQSERLRLGLPIYGSASEPGIAAQLPVTARPDGGLDMAITGLPADVNGVTFAIDRIHLRFKGIIRTKVRRRIRRKAFLTNPLACTPATSSLEVMSHDAPDVITRTSTFTPAGCK